LAGIWLQRDELRKQPQFVLGLGIVLFVFFFVIAYFGHLVARRLGRVQTEIAALAEKLDYAQLKAEDDFFDTEYAQLKYQCGLALVVLRLFFNLDCLLVLPIWGSSIYSYWEWYLACLLGMIEIFLWRKQRTKIEVSEGQCPCDKHQKQIESLPPPPNISFNPTPRQQASQDTSSDSD
jgi:hypothetical protein